MSSGFATRPYAGPVDLLRMIELVQANTAARWPAPAYWHRGDLTWGIYQNTVFDPLANIRLWESPAGQLLGFVWFRPPRQAEIELRHEATQRLALLDDMLKWATNRRTEVAASAGEAEVTLSTSALESDAERGDWLARHGFARRDNCFIRFRRALDRPIPAPALPPGFTVRPVAGEAEFEERVAIHREVWHPSKVTVEAYHRLRAAPGYTPELDLVVVAPAGGFAAYCIGWPDYENQVGLFEPVGARPAYRRQGLARAVNVAGLQRLQALGMRHAIVMTPNFNEPATALYRSVGFEEIDREPTYTRLLPVSS